MLYPNKLLAKWFIKVLDASVRISGTLLYKTITEDAANACFFVAGIEIKVL